MKSAYRNKFSKLDAAKSQLQKEFDSLTTLKLPASNVTEKLDSLNKVRENTLLDFDKKLQAVKDKTIGSLKSLDLPPEATEKLNAVTKNIESANVSSLDLPSLNISVNPIERLNDRGKLGDMSNVNLNNPLQTSGITEKAGDIKVLNPEATPLTGLTENVRMSRR